MSDLKEICKNNGIPANKNKAELVTYIANNFQPPPEAQREYLETKQKLESKGFNTDSVHHQYYREEFNSVDLLDRQWYKFTASYHHNHWRTKMFFSLFQVFLINSHKLYCETFREEDVQVGKPPIEMSSFRNILGLNLALIGEDDISEYDR